jgi:hypothetical protein
MMMYDSNVFVRTDVRYGLEYDRLMYETCLALSLKKGLRLVSLGATFRDVMYLGDRSDYVGFGTHRSDIFASELVGETTSINLMGKFNYTSTSTPYKISMALWNLYSFFSSSRDIFDYHAGSGSDSLCMANQGFIPYIYSDEKDAILNLSNSQHYFKTVTNKRDSILKVIASNSYSSVYYDPLWTSVDWELLYEEIIYSIMSSKSTVTVIIKRPYRIRYFKGLQTNFEKYNLGFDFINIKCISSDMCRPVLLPLHYYTNFTNMHKMMEIRIILARSASGKSYIINKYGGFDGMLVDGDKLVDWPDNDYPDGTKFWHHWSYDRMKEFHIKVFNQLLKYAIDNQCTVMIGLEYDMVKDQDISSTVYMYVDQIFVLLTL